MFFAEFKYLYKYQRVEYEIQKPFTKVVERLTYLSEHGTSDKISIAYHHFPTDFIVNANWGQLSQDIRPSDLYGIIEDSGSTTRLTLILRPSISLTYILPLLLLTSILAGFFSHYSSNWWILLLLIPILPIWVYAVRRKLKLIQENFEMRMNIKSITKDS